MKKYIIILLMLSATQAAQASEFPFTLHKLKSAEAGPTLLVVGGIQGDEPGGFNAASMLVTDYQITRGEVWVVPNLNFESIIKRSRGVYGDMNRKFLDISPDDPEYQAINKIKGIITSPQVSMVLNLHDGSGFYNTEYVDKDENPRRWGQSVVIDQASIVAPAFGNLESIANQAIGIANSSSRSSRESFLLKNTRTREGDKEMEKTLTYFAIKNGKPAMGVEASKSFGTERRIQSHLRFVEAIFDRVGIGYQREFDLSPEAIRHKLGQDIRLAMFNNKILYDIDKARKRIGYVPIKKESAIEFETNNPLVAIINSNETLKVRFGNRGVTTLNPQYFHYDNSLKEVEIEIDGTRTRVALGSVVPAANSFLISPISGRRVNVIGFRKPGKRNESDLLIQKKDISPRFSVDTLAQKFRVEFYRQDKYSGMILIDFSDGSPIEAAQQSTQSASSKVN